MPVSIPQLPNGTSNLQDVETRNTALSNTNEPTARNNVPSTRGQIASCSISSFDTNKNSQSQKMHLRAQRTPSRSGRPRGQLFRRPEDTLPLLHGKQLVKLTHSHRLLAVLMLQLRSLYPMLTMAHCRLTHTMAYAGIEYLDIVVEPVGSAIAPVSWH